MIRKLPPQVQSKLRSGVSITSPTQCVEELVLNSLDAGATCIAVRVDLSCFKLQVVDNGSGIQKEDLEKIGERYFTSKCHEEEDLDNLCYYGFRGEALSSLRDTSSILEVVSRHKSASQTYCRLFQKGKPLAVRESKIKRPSSGSTITAHDLFYNLPVRKKAINENLELERIRMRLEGIALMQPNISFTLRNDCTGSVILQTHKSNGLLSTFAHLFGTGKARLMSEVKGSKDHFSVEGFIGKECYSRKDIQFVYINSRMILKSRIHKLMNHILKRSMLRKRKMENNTSQNGNSSPVKSTDVNARYTLFVLNVHCPYSEYDITFDPTKTLVEFKEWEKVTALIQDVIHNFLRQENLFVKQPGFVNSPNSNDSPRDPQNEWSSSDESPNTNSKDSENAGVGYAKNISTRNAKDNLMSKTVKRKSTRCDLQDVESVLEDPVSDVPVPIIMNNDELKEQNTRNITCNSDDSCHRLSDILANADSPQKIISLFSSPTQSIPSNVKFHNSKSSRSESDASSSGSENISPQLIISDSPQEKIQGSYVLDSEDPLSLLEHNRRKMNSTDKVPRPEASFFEKAKIPAIDKNQKTINDSGYLSFESEDPLCDQNVESERNETLTEGLHLALYQNQHCENQCIETRGNSVKCKSICSFDEKRKSIVENVRKSSVQKNNAISEKSFQHNKRSVSLLQKLRKCQPGNKLQQFESGTERSFHEADIQESKDSDVSEILSTDSLLKDQSENIPTVLSATELEQIEVGCSDTSSKTIVQQNENSVYRKRSSKDQTLVTTASKLSRLMRQTQQVTSKGVPTNRHSLDFQLEPFRNPEIVVNSPPKQGRIGIEAEPFDTFFRTDRMVQTGWSVLHGDGLCNTRPEVDSGKSVSRDKVPSENNLYTCRSECIDYYKSTTSKNQGCFKGKSDKIPFFRSDCCACDYSNITHVQERLKHSDYSSSFTDIGNAHKGTLNLEPILSIEKEGKLYHDDSSCQSRNQSFSDVTSSYSSPETNSNIIFCGSPYGYVKQSSKIPFSDAQSEGDTTIQNLSYMAPQREITMDISGSHPTQRQSSTDLLHCLTPDKESTVEKSHCHTPQSESLAHFSDHHIPHLSQSKNLTRPSQQGETTIEMLHCPTLRTEITASQGFSPADTYKSDFCTQEFAVSSVFEVSSSNAPSPTSSTVFSPCLSHTQDHSSPQSENLHQLETYSYKSGSNADTISQKTTNHSLVETKNYSEELFSASSLLLPSENLSQDDSVSFTQLIEKYGHISQDSTIPPSNHTSTSGESGSEPLVKFIDLFQQSSSETSSALKMEDSENKVECRIVNKEACSMAAADFSVQLSSVVENCSSTESERMEDDILKKTLVDSDLPDKSFDESGEINQIVVTMAANESLKTCVDSVDLFTDCSGIESCQEGQTFLLDGQVDLQGLSKSGLNVNNELGTTDSLPVHLLGEEYFPEKQDICQGIAWDEEMNSPKATRPICENDGNREGKGNDSEISVSLYSDPLHEIDCEMACSQKDDLSSIQTRNVNCKKSSDLSFNPNKDPSSNQASHLSTKQASDLSSNQAGDTAEPVWCHVKDPDTGNLIHVNSVSGHTITDKEWTTVTTDHTPDSTPKLEEFDKNILQLSNKNWKKAESAGLSLTSHNALLTMMEEHFDEAVGVKWRDSSEISSSELSSSDQKGKSVEDLLEDWDNPVFDRPEVNVLEADEISNTRASRKAYRTLNPCRFTKSMLNSLKLLGQVDNKFIACLMSTEEKTVSPELDMLVLIDQHAAHERVRLEQLTADATEQKKGPREGEIISARVEPAELLQLSQEEVRLLSSFKSEFKRVGIEFSADKSRRDCAWIHAIPACIVKREASELKRKRDSTVWDTVETLIKEHVELLKSTHGATGRLPQTVHKILCSQACHGAIKFGDPLTSDECKNLLQSLSTCMLPFQCAHGRPSVMPLLSLRKLQEHSKGKKRPQLWKIAKKIQEADFS